MNIQTKILLRSMIRQLVIFLELANKLDEDEFRKLIPLVKAQKQNIKGVLDNAGRGNLFMMVFFIRELIESLLNEESSSNQLLNSTGLIMIYSKDIPQTQYVKKCDN